MKKRGLWAGAVSAIVALVLFVAPAMAASNVVLCQVDIGDDTSEAGHNLNGWGDVEPDSSKGNWGGFIEGEENCRVIWEADDDKEATITLDRCCERGAAKAIEVRHLDGIADDSFDIYVKDVHGSWVKIGSWAGSPGSENWVVTTFDIPNGKVLQLDRGRAIEVKFVATGDPWSGFNTYGQVAIDWIKLIGNGKK